MRSSRKAKAYRLLRQIGFGGLDGGRCAAGSRSGAEARIECLEPRMLLAADMWNGGSGNWDVPGNWSLGTVPNSSTDVDINASGDYTVTLNNASYTVNSLTLGGASGSQELLLENSLTVSSASAVDANGTLDLDGGTFGGSATLTNSGSVILQGSTISSAFSNQQSVLVENGSSGISGALGTASNSTIEVLAQSTSGGNLTVSNGFTNDGAIDLVDDDDITSANYYAGLTVSSGVLTNASGGTITTTTNTGANTTVYDGLTGSITNDGSLSVEGPTLLDNYGDTFTNAGSVSIAAGQAFEVIYGDFEQDGGTLTGGGTLNLGTDAPTFVVESSFSDGGVVLLFTTNTIDGSATFTNVAGTTLALKEVSFQAPLVNDGTLLEDENYSTVSGQLTTAAGSTIQINASSTSSGGLAVSNAFTNNGAINLVDDDTSTSANYYSDLNITSGTLTNASGGKITTTTDTGSNTTVYDEIEGNITNDGTLSIDGPTLLDNYGDTFTNAGSVSIASGQSLEVIYGDIEQAGGTLTGGGTLNLENDAPTFVVQSNFSDGGVVLLFSVNTIDGSATFTNIAGNTLTLNQVSFQAALVNEGTLLEDENYSTISGQLTTAAGSTIQISASTTSSGGLVVSNAFTNNGAINLVDDDTSTSANYYTDLNVTSGTLTNASGATITTSTDTGSNTTVYDELEGNITNDGSLSVEGPTLLDNYSDTFTNAGTASIAPGQALEVIYGDFDQDGGTLTGGGTLNLENDAPTFVVQSNFSDGGVVLLFTTNTINGSATFTNIAGNTLALNQVSFQAPLLNDGTLLDDEDHATISGQLTTAAGSTIQISAGSTSSGGLVVSNAFTNNGTVNIVDDDTSTSANYYAYITISSGAMTNASGGIVTATTNTGSNTTVYDELTGNITNDGSLSIEGPTLLDNYSDTFTNQGTVTIGSGQALQVIYGDIDQDGGILTGGGTLNLENDAPTFTVQSNFSDGGVFLLFSTNTINGSATFTNIGGNTLTLNQVSFQASLVNDGTLLDDEYYATITGQLTTGANSTIQITASSTSSGGLLVSNAFTNNGAINLTDDDTSTSADYYAYLTISSGIMTNGVSGKITTAFGASVNVNVYAEVQGNVDNEGVISIDATALFESSGNTLSNVGTINVSAGLTITDSFPQTGGILDFLEGEIFGSFSLGGGSIEGSGEISGTLSVPADDAGVIAVNSGMITAGAVSIGTGGSLNVGNNELMIKYGTGADPMATIYGYLKSGYNNGGWNGSGIFSTAAQTPTNGLEYGLGYSDGKDGVVSGLTSGEIEVKYTLVGDANLDGAVNGSDFSILAAHFGEGATNWDEGNFLYGTSVNGSDFSALAANFGQGDSGVAVASVETANDPLNVEVNTEVNVGQDIGMTSRTVLGAARESRAVKG